MTDLSAYVEQSRELQHAYLASNDPMEQSGFGAGAERWEAERRPLVDAIGRDGDFLDVGCANGYLVECVAIWAAEVGHRVVPHGLDLGPELIELARTRHGEHAANFHVGDVWTWEPERRYDFVYGLTDLGPKGSIGSLIERLASWVEPGGRLILGSYGSRSRGIEPTNIASIARERGFEVTGSASGGNPVVTRFIWIDA